MDNTEAVEKLADILFINYDGWDNHELAQVTLAAFQADPLAYVKPKPITFERQEDATYAWVFGMHFYSEQDEDGMWPTSMMTGGEDVWEGITCKSIEDAEAHIQEYLCNRVKELF